MNDSDLQSELNRQINNLVQKGYPQIEGLDISAIKKQIGPLPNLDLEKGTLPFVIVVKSSLISAEDQMERVEKNGKKGVTILRPHTSVNFKTIEEVKTPKENFYLMVDIDRGKENINLPPSEAIKIIEEQGRSPLTIDEGIALVTQFPEFLIKNNCFSLLGSRTGHDQRVPAI